MKKALSFAVALGLVGGMAATASAVEFSGTSRVQGVMVDSSQGAAEDKKQEYNMRTRLTMKAMVADNVSVNTRHTLISTYFGDGNMTSQNETIDMAYINVKDLVGASWDVGRIPANWTKFTAWGGFADRVKATFKSGNIVAGGFLQKVQETTPVDNTSGGDNDSYAAFVKGSAGDIKYGVLLPYSINHGDLDVDGDCKTGFKMLATVSGKAGNIGWGGELVLTSGTIYEDAGGDEEMALRADVKVAVNDQLTVTGDLAYATSDFNADDDYNVTNLLGNSVTAMGVFGDDKSVTATADDTAYILAGGATMKLDDASSIGAKVAYYLATENGMAADDTTFIELDATYTRSLAKNTTLTVQAAYAMPDNWTVADDEVIALGWRLATKF